MVRIIETQEEADEVRRQARADFASKLKAADLEEMVGDELLDKWYGEAS